MGSKSGKMSHSGLSMKERYEAAMVLSGVGDALGFKNGGFEFCHSGAKILEEVKSSGGFKNIQVKLPNWMVSDDTVMHLATAEALCLDDCQSDREKLLLAIAENYALSMKDMNGRAPGQTCMSGARNLRSWLEKGYQQPFNAHGGGCGAAMRAMCIGLRYSKPEELDDLIGVSVESGRMTHHHPVGYLGAMAASLFTAYSLQGKPVIEWGSGLLQTVDKAHEYVSASGHAVQENLDAWSNFTGPWKKYLSQRGILDGHSQPIFPENYDVNARDAFYKSISYSGWGGASGHDAPMIAYDALLYAFDDWRELCERAMFHGGDSDSTGVIAGACYGARHGFHGVPQNHYKNLEYRERLEQCGKKLLALSKREDNLDAA